MSEPQTATPPTPAELARIDQAMRQAAARFEAAPPGSADAASAGAQLTEAALARFRHSGEPGDLGQAVKGLEAQADCDALRTIGGVAMNIFVEGRDQRFLSVAAAALFGCVKHAEQGDPATVIEALGMLVQEQALEYHAFGDPAVLDRAVEAARFAVGFAERTGQQSITAKQALRDALEARYQWLDRPGDYEACSEASMDLSRSLADQPIEQAKVIANHAYLMLTRYIRLGDNPQELGMATRLFGAALTMVPEDDGGRLVILTDAALALKYEYLRSHDPALLDRAIAYHEEAVAKTPRASLEYPGRLAQYAAPLLDRFDARHDTDDLDVALDLLRQVRDLTPTSSSAFPGRMSTVVRAWQTAAAQYGDPELLESSVAVLLAALQAPATRFSFGVQLGRQLLEILADPALSATSKARVARELGASRVDPAAAHGDQAGPVARVATTHWLFDLADRENVAQGDADFTWLVRHVQEIARGVANGHVGADLLEHAADVMDRRAAAAG